jgi:acyl-CoA synthetase (AMP-forming)/AMP-acid ligase II
VNNYGPTESTVVATSGVIAANETVLHIGTPISNTQIYILDRYGRPVPIGAPGEIYIGGASVAQGYLNRPELSAERFLADPFSTSGKTRMYKTGDMARWRPNGTIEYLGRNDAQVKVRGNRVELGEVESVLLEHPAVTQAVVLARETTPENQQLVAYVVCDRQSVVQTTSIGTSELTRDTVADEWEHLDDPSENVLRQQIIPRLRKHLNERLPEYMVPAAWMILKHLPLTVNGKVDRRALPLPQGRSDDLGEYIAPSTRTGACGHLA